jgi:hypothetical protein
MTKKKEKRTRKIDGIIDKSPFSLSEKAILPKKILKNFKNCIRY